MCVCVCVCVCVCGVFQEGNSGFFPPDSLSIGTTHYSLKWNKPSSLAVSSSEFLCSSHTRERNGNHTKQRNTADQGIWSPWKTMSHRGDSGSEASHATSLPEKLLLCCLLLVCSKLFVCFLIFLNVYLFLRERQSVSREGTEREGDTESKAESRLWAVSTEPDTDTKPTNHEIMTWAEV